jgi:hypothetical protein
VICAIGVFARTDFPTPAGSVEARAPFTFWILLLAVWGALNTVFLGGDLFTLYVALELLTFAAVPGWTEYDPTNGLVAGSNLVRVGVTRSAAQALPVSGGYVGNPDDSFGLNVDVAVSAVPI